MSKDAVDIFAKLVLTTVAGILLGYRAYIAWFFPDEHAEHLKIQRFVSRSWISKGEVYTPSDLAQWFFKLSYTFLFLLTLGIWVWTIVSLGLH